MIRICVSDFKAVLGIRIRMFLCHSDPLVTSTNPDPALAPSIIKQK
jgi:hypothetical protein